MNNGDEFYITLHLEHWFEGRTEHRYWVGREFIYPAHTNKHDSDFFKVLDDNNPMYDYFKALYAE